MPTLTTTHHPQLTVEQVMDVFAKRLADKYDVRVPTTIERWLSGKPDLVVAKTRWAAVGVHVQQNLQTTSFTFEGMEPPIVYLGLLAAVVGMLVAAVIAWITLKSSWKAIEADITWCIENAPEFKQAVTPGKRRGSRTPLRRT